MDKQQLISIINTSSTDDALKKTLIELVDAEPALSYNTIRAVRLRLEQEAEDAFENVANLQIRQAADVFNRQMDVAEKDLDALVADAGAQADRLDLATARTNMHSKVEP